MRLRLLALGALASLTVLTVFEAIAPIVFPAALPNWLGTDYVDARGTALSFALQLALCGLAFFALGRRTGRPAGLPAWLASLWLCNPVSLGAGVIGVRCLFGVVPSELTPGFLLVLLGWPFLWRLTTLGADGQAWRRGVLRALGYAAALLAVALVQIGRVYGS